ncbi:transmembrane and coiled-coil domain-containing protein 6 [Macrotis lagotis]|uniref:transmembrane and coiled-coil domain-containing protein 6 n=1 Tax=Macrotis lagotis TaxID=92651 RepID=UPI003D68B198
MWSHRSGRLRAHGYNLQEQRDRWREREAALRKARREQHLVSKRLLRDSDLEEGRDEFQNRPLEELEVLHLLRMSQRGTEKEKEKALISLRHSLQHPETQQTFIRLEGGIRTLIGLLTSSWASLQMEAARCLHELSHADQPNVAEACLPSTSYLLTYLSGHSADFIELCLYTLGNLAVESEAVRRQLMPQGIIPALALCIQSPHAAVLEALGYTLSQLLQANEAPKEIIPSVLDSAILPNMLRLLHPTPELGASVAVEFAWCLHYIICSQVNNPLLISRGALSSLGLLLMDLARAASGSVDTGLDLLACPVLRCFGNLLAEEGAADPGVRADFGDERIIVAMFILMEFFIQHQPSLVPECLWVLNNLTVKDPGLCTALLSLDLVAPLLQLLPISRVVRILVLTILCNIAEKGPFYCQRLWPGPLLPHLLDILTLSDSEVVGQSLELLQLLFVHQPESAQDFLQHSGLQALEKHKEDSDLQERIQALEEVALGGSSLVPNALALP